jgi:outer membrane receptor protein involved in Fe transport
VRKRAAARFLSIRNRAVNLRILVGALAATAALHAEMAAAVDSPVPTYNFDIPAQKLNDALQALAFASQHKLLYASKLVNGRQSPPLKGEYTTEEAVRKLLAGTELVYQVTPDGLVVIRDRESIRTPTSSTAGLRAGELRMAAGESRQWPSGNFADDPAAARDDARAVTSDGSEDAGGMRVEEIIVTAQKRIERLQEVPVPVTAIGGDTLSNSNQFRIQDYYARVPGLNFTLTGDTGQPTISIRGVTTAGFSNPTVAILIDDIPYGPSISQGTTPNAPDIDPSDLARVEVLRGPQGTLYGASSIGGLLKFVTVDPSTDGVSGRIQGGLSSISHSSDLGYNGRGWVNVPLTDTLAVRASAFTRSEAGYIDNPQTGERDVNDQDTNGGRVSALWKPSESFRLKLNALYQDSERKGADSVDTQLGTSHFAQGAVKNSGTYDRKTQAYSAIADASLGGLDLTSATGYSIDELSTRNDITQAAGGFFSSLAGSLFGVTGVTNPFSIRTEKFSQELRATLPIGERLSWLFGAFYTHEKFTPRATFAATEPDSGQRVGEMLAINVPTTYEEYAGFTDLTVHFTDRFDVQFGGRISENQQAFSTVRTGPLAAVFFGGDPSIVPGVDSKDHAFTYLVTPRLKLSPELMVYARFASGYRPGGPNPTCSGAVVCQYDADTTQNAELGIKGNVLDRLLSFDISAYTIQWKDIQIFFTDPATGLGVIANASRARSQGLEVSVESRPVTGLTLAAWIALSDAELREDIPATLNLSGKAGARLPFSSRLSGSFSVDQEFPVWSGSVGFIGGSLSYVGDRKGTFQPTPTRQSFPGYAQLDLRAGLRYGSWEWSAFVNNATDRRGELRGGLDSSVNPSYFNYTQPPTAGISLAKSF